MFTGTLTADLLLGDVHSLKGKRAVVRPIVAELRRRFAVVRRRGRRRRTCTAARRSASPRWRATPVRSSDVLDACERLLAERPEVTLLSTHRQLFSD